MIISGYDGINATMVIDGIALKALRGLLEQVTTDQCRRASEKLLKDNHPYTIDDVQCVAQTFTQVTRILNMKLHERVEAAENEPKAAQ